jgi:uncharacterized 2Fe-2S/4Fe-4S cluster protein (DUF4445 family)
MHELKVSFQPSGRRVFVLPGTGLLEAAERAGIILQTPCGGKGTCGKCQVRVEGADVLACAYVIDHELVVEVPDRSLFAGGQQILVTDAGRAVGVVDPPVRVIPFSLASPTQADSASDLDRLRQVLQESLCCRLEVLQGLSARLRKYGWQGRAVVAGERLLGILPVDGEDPVFGVAVDVGTTTVVGTLIDLVTGSELAVASRMNGQIRAGDDVIARIQRVREAPAALQDLQQAVIRTLQDIIDELVEHVGAGRDAVFEIALAGNSTMQQLLLGLDCSALGEVPFVQVFTDAITCPAVTVGLAANPGAEVYVFPQIGGFVGGDTVAGIVATQLDRQSGAVLFVDIGTNGEIVLAHEGILYATSTAAGPAFEGARIRQGMRAVPGAIEKVMIGAEVVINVIGNLPPAGLCGTALIDAVAELLRAGILDETGRFREPDELPETLPDAVRACLRPDGGDWCFVLAVGEGGRDAVCLWQRDVRELQLAAGAIRAGVSILLNRAGLTADDLGAVLLAGAFGNYIRRHQARRIGLLPAIPEERMHFVGNAASLGAKMVLLSRGERERASQLIRHAEHVDLSLDPEFQFEFGMAMIFPGPEADGDCSAVLGG